MYFYFCILKAARSPYAAQNGLKLELCLRLTSAEITGVIHALLKFFVFTNSNNNKYSQCTVTLPSTKITHNNKL